MTDIWGSLYVQTRDYEVIFIQLPSKGFFFLTRISSPSISTRVIITLCWSLLFYFNQKTKGIWELLHVGIPSSHILGFLLPSWSELEARSWGLKGRKPLLFVTLAWVMVIYRCHQHSLHWWWPEVMVTYIWLCPFSSDSPSGLLRSQSFCHSNMSSFRHPPLPIRV